MYLYSTLIILVLLLSGCSVNHTLSTANFYAGELGIADQQLVHRQRLFTLPSNSKIMVAPLSGYYPGPVHHPISEELTRELSSRFVGVTSTSAEKNLRQLFDFSKVEKQDFLITVELVSKEDSIDRDNEEPMKPFADALYFDHAMVKLALYDARTCKLIDLAYIKSRSGLLISHNQTYSSLLREGLYHYANSLSSHQFIGIRDSLAPSTY